MGFRETLRTKCLIIGYLNLFACTVDIVFQMLVSGIVTNWFQCDITKERIQYVNWPWLEPLLLVVNLGTHGFMPFPMVQSPCRFLLEYWPLAKDPRCYPGILHIHLEDLLSLFINIIWLKFSVYFISAVYKGDRKQITVFYHIAAVKLGLEVLYYAFEANFFLKSSWLILDIAITLIFLVIMRSYITVLKNENQTTDIESSETKDLPPTYVECLINPNFQPIPPAKEVKEDGSTKKDGIAVINVTN